MGYLAELTDSKFHIAKSQHKACLSAIKQLMGPQYDHLKQGGSWQGGNRITACYSWVDTEEVLKARTLDEALLAWGYVVCLDNNGDITAIEQENGETKLGQEGILFDTIRPFVTPGSYIKFRGEDDEEFGWEFGKPQPIVKKRDRMRRAVPSRKISWA